MKNKAIKTTLSGQHLRTLSLCYWIKKDWDACQSKIKHRIDYFLLCLIRLFMREEETTIIS